MVGIELQVARGIVALLGHHEIIGLTTFAVNLLVSIGIAAGTDYGIFFIGRYQEARQDGEDRETAYYTTYRGVAKVVLASGLTIAGAALLPELHPAALLPDPRHPLRGGRIGRGRGRAHAVPGGHCGRRPVRPVRAQAEDQGRAMAADRHGDRAVAGAHPRRDIGGRAGRAVDAAVDTNPATTTRNIIPKDIPASQGNAAAAATFSAVGNDVPEISGRGRSRSAKSCGFSGTE